jgi:photosystem II stability/assembly factor-like uncharacterized protein
MKVIMGRDLTSDLTKQYSTLFEKRGIKRIFSFAQDVYKSGKLREIVSFAVWEMFHKLGLFPKKDYLVFDKREAIKLSNKTPIGSSEFDAATTQFFAGNGLHAVKCELNWKLLYFHKGEIIGCIYPDDCDLYKSVDGGKTVVFMNRFPESIKSIFVSSQNTILVCLKGSLYKSSDAGRSFEKTLDLGSPISFFRFNNAITETPKKVLLAGEYGNIWDKTGWRKLAYIYISSNDGKTWKTSDFLIQKGTNKHVHIVKYSRILNKVMVADGDNYKKLWLSDSLETTDFENPNWNPVNKLHIQMGGYTGVVESNGKVLFGTDYQGGTNFLVETADGKKFSRKIVPDPYRRSPIDNMILRKSKIGEEIWANLPFSTPNSKCLLMYTTDNGKSWNKIFEYNRSTHTVWLIHSSTAISDELYFSVEDLNSNERVVYRITDN